MSSRVDLPNGHLTDRLPLLSGDLTALADGSQPTITRTTDWSSLARSRSRVRSLPKGSLRTAVAFYSTTARRSRLRPSSLRPALSLRLTSSVSPSRTRPYPPLLALTRLPSSPGRTSPTRHRACPSFPNARRLACCVLPRLRQPSWAALECASLAYLPGCRTRRSPGVKGPRLEVLCFCQISFFRARH